MTDDTDDTEDSNPLKTKLDAMALEIAEQITVGQPVPQEVLKAMEVLTGLSKWYGIRQKLTPDGDGEGDGINGYQKKLRAAEFESDQRGGRGRDSDDRDEFAHLADDDPAESQRAGNGRTGRRNGVKKSGAPGYPNGSEYRHDDDTGGPDLDRIMASLPRNIGGAGGNRRRGRAAGDSNAGGVGGGVPGVGSDPQSEPDDTLGNGSV